MENPEMTGKTGDSELLKKISETSREFIRLISSSSLENIRYERDDILKLIDKNEELIKERDEIMSLFVDLKVIPTKKNE